MGPAAQCIHAGRAISRDLDGRLSWRERRRLRAHLSSCEGCASFVCFQLEQRAAANPQKLNWRTSIVDLLKLLDIDSSLAARKELATELGCPAELMADSAQMNMWLHKTVLAQIAANGGNVPQDLLN